MQEVRWRLFRREDMPARIRRLQRLEQIAQPEWPDGEEPTRDGDETRG